MTASLPMQRSDLPTPVLIIDLQALDRNIAAMAHFACARTPRLTSAPKLPGVSLR